MTRHTFPAIVGALALVAMGALPVAAQTGQIQGQVTDRSSQQPLVGAQVFLDGTTYGSLTQENGRYAIPNVPPGVYTVRVQLLGHAPGREENVRVVAGQTANVNFALGITALKLEEVVVTGTADPIAGVKVPFTVGKVTKADLPVPAVTAESSLQGRVAGVRVVKPTGQPGSGADVLLRGATSITKNNEPLYVVDGVILAASLVDLDAQDIESIEVVKGAAAASLYGSRASAGVIQITTNRGRDVQEGQTRIMVRSEYGFNQLELRRNYITSHHHYRVSGNSWVDATGNPVDKSLRAADADLIADNAYPGPIFNHLDRFFNDGSFLTTSVSIAQNTRNTNFMASFNTRNDEGVVNGICDPDLFRNAGGVPDECGNDGASLYGLRLNLDHRLRDDLNFSVSSYYSRHYQEDYGGADVFYNIMFQPPDVDLLTPNEDGQPFLIQPDPFTLQANPLYAIAYADNQDYRSRYSGSLTTRYSPANWFSLEANFSYDRSDRNENNYTPLGFKNLTSASTGSVTRRAELEHALNANLTASLLRSFGDLTMRTKLQYLIEREVLDERQGAGNTLAVKGVEDIDVAVNESGFSNYEDIRSAGFFAITGLDYRGKYIGEALIRRDGSSLFGEEDRWHTYYRGSAAWRMSEEPWWFIPALNEFKLRYSIGTAGGRPDFGNRFEVWSVSSGSVSKGTLGNKLLRPEHQTEQEFGIDMIMNNRYSMQLVYAKSKVEDQLLEVPLPGLYGYSTQWQNAGTLESSTYEATLETMLVQRPGFQWSMNVVADRTRSEITEFDRGCYGTTPYYCAGYQIGTLRGYRFLDALDQVAAKHPNAVSQFDINDDGLVVWVGEGNTYKDGIAKGLWGSKAVVDGVNYDWGLPFVEIDEAGIDALVPIGDVNPEFHLGMSQNVQWRGFNLFALVDGTFGGDIYNNTRQWAYRDNTHADYDQFGRPDELKKPVTYYQRVYRTNSRTSWFVEDGSYVKLRELSLQYSFNRNQLGGLFGGLGMERLTVGLIGRNLWTITDYTGFDPEVGSIRAAFDGFDYPNFRTFTIKMDVQF
ncbi:MAG: SusC/RagA family TonB-linked outer membrane protein [Gemmatimonadetes bacterium]|nr:SusC/RagA family TonB-linked outer membrane protein [Gemmatimonadota bacterium]